MDIVVGHAYQEAFAGPAGLVLLGLGLLVTAVAAVARWLASHPVPVRAAARWIANQPLVREVVGRYRDQLTRLGRRLGPDLAYLLWLAAGLVAFTGCGWLLGEVTEDVIEREELATQDSPVTAWLAEHRVGWLTAAMRVLTWLGSGWVVVPLVVLATAVLVTSGRRRRAIGLALVAVAGTGLLVTAIKLLIARPRPDIVTLLTIAEGYSFPSGHAAQAAAAYATIAYLASRAVRRWRHRVVVWSTAVLLIILVGFSRLYLGAHWLTDVIGGYALAGAWLATVFTAANVLARLRAVRGGVSHHRGGLPSGEGRTSPST